MAYKNSERDEALAILKSGRSVMFTVDGQRKIFTVDNIEELPTEAALAAGNPEATEAAIDNIEEQIKTLEEAKKRLAASKKEVKAVEKEEAKKEEPKASEKKDESK